MKLTREYLERKGFYGKYKSIHVRWCKDGFCFDQAPDVDEFGEEIPETDEFYYNNKEIGTIENLKRLYFEKTGKRL